MKGFTFVEFLITVFIFAFIVAAIYGVLHIANISSYTDLGLLDLQQQARQAMAWIVREIRESSSVTITTIDADSDQITFDTPNETGIQYYRSANQLIREYPTGTTRVIADNISRLKFSPSGDILQIELRADKTAVLRPLSFSLTEQVRLRNR